MCIDGTRRGVLFGICLYNAVGFFRRWGAWVWPQAQSVLGSQAISLARSLFCFPLYSMCLLGLSTFPHHADAHAATPYDEVGILKISNESSTPAQDYKNTPPFSGEYFWGKFIELLRKKSGYVTKEMFEDQFNVKFEEIEKTEESAVYRISKGDQWYLEVNLTITNEKFKMPAGMGFSGALSALSIGWSGTPKTPTNQPDFNWCISQQKATEDILASGWSIATQQENGMKPLYTEFRRSDKKSSLIIHTGFLYREKCVFAVSVQAEP